MRILFLIHSMTRVRHFESVIQSLAERGHDVRVAVADDRVKLPLSLAGNVRISAVHCPTERSDSWADLAPRLRLARDYFRYLHPRFREANVLIRRAREAAPPTFVRFCGDHAWVRGNVDLVARALAEVENLIPSDGVHERFLQSERPDVVLVTPLVHFGSYQTDYVKSAHRLGLPVIYLPFSWDNLTNKGLIRISPDRVLVWNDVQKWEAVNLHGVPSARVVVTGAPRFDGFFSLAPSSDRRRFMKQVGLDANRPYLLYLCSSELVAPREEEFVRQWVRAIRGAEDPVLRGCGLLIRRHPADVKVWDRAGLAAAVNVVLGDLDASKQSSQGLYDSLFHAASVVGVNTSAMIEAGIVGKSVHAIHTHDSTGDRRTLHFEYLLEANGGLVSVARDFDEHFRQLSEALRSQEARRVQSLRFVEGFVRPHGLDREVTPIMVEEIECARALAKTPKRASLPIHHAVRWALRCWLASDSKSRLPSPTGRSVVSGFRLRGRALIRGGSPFRVSKRVRDAGSRMLRAALRGTRGETPLRDLARSATAAGAEAVIGQLVAERVRNLHRDDAGRWLSDLAGRFSMEQRARYYSRYDLTRKMDYERHEIRLRLSSPYIKYRVQACAKEPFTLQWIEDSVRPGDVLYDIGANVGSYSLIAAKFSKGEARVFAFEPSFSTYADLCWNIMRNGCADSVVPLPIALWSNNSVRPIAYRDVAAGAARHRLASDDDGGKAAYRGSILTARIDDLVGTFGLPSPTLMKLDVDGAELGVLEGALETLSGSSLRSLIVEVNVHDDADVQDSEVARLLDSLGFRLRERHRRGKAGAPPYCVFVKVSGA